MSLLEGFQIGRAILTLLEQPNPAAPEVRQATAKIIQSGARAVPKLISALNTRDDTRVIEDLLIKLLTPTTYPLYVEALSHEQAMVQNKMTGIFRRARTYNINELLLQLDNPDVSKNNLGDIFKAQIDRIDARGLLKRLGTASSSARAVIYQLLDQIVTEAQVPDIEQMIDTPDPLIRTFLVRLLGRFKNSRSQRVLIKLLSDDNKLVRQSAAKGLAVDENNEFITQALCERLDDADLTVQTAAIESLVHNNDPHTIKYLIPILQDESEYVRRAAVEVLNEVGDQTAIKDLLRALKDADWWVKVRAADALGRIGGPKVVDAVAGLLKDKDEFLRRTAVEILNTNGGKRAYAHLIGALNDSDWWVRERAVDALAGLGDQRAVRPLLELSARDDRAAQVVNRAMLTFNAKTDIRPLLEHLQTESALSSAAANALQFISGESAVPKTGIDRQSRPPPAAESDAPTRVLANASGGSNEADETRIIDATLLRSGEMLAERYRVIKQIGKGAFGVVVLVEDMVVHDQHILKFLSPFFASDETMIKRFTQELRYARRVTHENVIRIYDFVTMGKSYAISMEYFPSHSLGEELAAQKPLDLRHALMITRAVCKGMEAAQNVNVVHRDLKPANILLDEKKAVKIVDFGLAAAASRNDSRLTKSGLLVGTPTYMAPEQVRGQTLDSRTDMYALGIIMYQMATGKPPYHSGDSMSILFQHAEGKAPPPRELNPKISTELDAVIRKAMANNPADRYQHFNELRQAVDTLLAGMNDGEN